MAGGYREGSGRSKSGYYKGIYCGSTYELCWVIYSLDHNIGFTRFPKILEKNGVKYFPDFLLADQKTIIETKGYENQDSVDRKTEVAQSHGYIVCVLRKEDLQYAFDYVKQTYNTSKFYELYDEYKPKYTHVCSLCKKEFHSDKVLKTELKFCSRSCSGRNRKLQNNTKEVNEKISKKLTGRSVKSYKRKYKQIWITDGSKNTRIMDGGAIPEGFTKGRMSL